MRTTCFLFFVLVVFGAGMGVVPTAARDPSPPVSSPGDQPQNTSHPKAQDKEEAEDAVHVIPVMDDSTKTPLPPPQAHPHDQPKDDDTPLHGSDVLPHSLLEGDNEGGITGLGSMVNGLVKSLVGGLEGDHDTSSRPHTSDDDTDDDGTDDDDDDDALSTFEGPSPHVARPFHSWSPLGGLRNLISQRLGSPRIVGGFPPALASCAPDIHKFCPNEHSPDDIHACLMGAKDVVSEPCRAALHGETRPHPFEIVHERKLPGGVTEVTVEDIVPMKQNHPPALPDMLPVGDAFDHVFPDLARREDTSEGDAFLHSTTAIHCLEDRRSLCRGVQDPLSCLRGHWSALSDSCREALLSWSLGSCTKNALTLCSKQVKDGIDAVRSCLKANADALSSECRLNLQLPLDQHPNDDNTNKDNDKDDDYDRQTRHHHRRRHHHHKDDDDDDDDYDEEEDTHDHHVSLGLWVALGVSAVLIAILVSVLLLKRNNGNTRHYRQDGLYLPNLSSTTTV